MKVQKRIIYDFSSETDVAKTSECSIVKIDSGFVLNIGMTNKTQPERQLTLNRKVVLDENFDIVSDDVMQQAPDSRRIAGVSDIRLRKEDDKIMFHGHALHPNGLMAVVTGEYMSPLNFEYMLPSNFTQWVKDWVFVEFADGWHVIESWSPLTIGTVVDGTFEVKFQLETPSLKGVTGATNGYYFNEELYFIVRNKERQHKIVVFSDQMDEIKRQTEWFSFEDGDPEAEKALGLIVSDAALVVAYNNAKVAVLDIPNIINKTLHCC